MSKYTKKVVISYDADEAGKKAASKAMRLLEEVGLEVKVLSVPGAKDPDEYIKNYGADKFREVITGAKTKFEYNFESVVAKYDVNIPQDKINAVAEMEKLISEVYSAAERDVYIKTVAERLGVDFKSVKADVDRIISRRTSEIKRSERTRVKQEAAGYSDRINPDFIKVPAIARNEENVLSLLLVFPEHRKDVFENNLVDESFFITNLNKRIFICLRKAFDEGDSNLILLNQELTLEEVGRVAKMKISRMQITGNGRDVLIDSINQLKRAVSKKNSESNTTMDGLLDLIKNKRNG